MQIHKLLLLLLTFLLTAALKAQNIAWAVSMGGPNTDRGNAIRTDVSGNVYSTGNFLGTVDFDPGPGVFNMTANSSGSDMFIQKLDANGNFVWAKQLVGDSSSTGLSLALDGSGHVYISGWFRGTKDFDPGTGVYSLTAIGNADMYVLKLDANGNFVWAKQMSGTTNEGGFGIASDNSGNVFITGYFNGTVDFDPGGAVYNLISFGNYDIFVSRLDASGNFVWAKQIGGTGNDNSLAIALDPTGNVFITGSFTQTADFDPGPGVYNLTAAGTDIFIEKLDMSGNFFWAKQMVGNASGIGYSLATDGLGNVYYTGAFFGTIDFDPGSGIYNLTSIVNSYDIVISKLDISGNFVWAKQMGSNFGDRGYSIFLDVAANVYTTGEYGGTVDFDPGPGLYNLTSAGVSDIFIQKLDSSGSFVSAVSMGGPSDDIGYAIAVSNAGNIHATGSFRNTADFDPGSGIYNLTSVGNTDIFIQKLTQCSTTAQPGPITGNTNPCSGSSQVYSISAVTGATSYTWTLPSGWTGSSTTTSITATVGANSGNITVAANNSCGSSSAQVLAVVANLIPAQPGTISGSNSVCQGSSQTYSISAVAGATSYTWTLPPGWAGSSTTTSISTTVGANSGNISVAANNSCGNSSPRTLAITVHTAPPAQPGAISGNNPVCQGSSQTYSISAVSGATSYTWTLPSGWTGASTTTSITVTAGASGGNISVTANNGCGNSTAQNLAVTVNPVPPQPGIISGNNSVCQGSSQTYSIGTVSGATSYTWTLPAGWTGSSTTTSITATVGVSGGNLSVTANNSCGSSPAQTLSVTVNIFPAQPGTISGNSLVCQGSSQTYSISPVSGATSYTWILPSGWTGTSITNSINATVGANGGNISVTANNACGSSSSQIQAVTVNSIPAQPGTITGNIAVTIGQDINYSIIAVSGATGYNWVLSGGGSITSGQNTTGVIVNWTTAGNYTLSVNAGNSCGSSSVQNLSVIVSTVTGTVDPPNPFQIKIVPNPSEGDVYLMAKGVIHKKIRIEVMNLSGQIVYSNEQKAASNDYSLFLDLNKLSSGVYKVKIFIDKKVYVRSIAKM